MHSILCIFTLIDLVLTCSKAQDKSIATISNLRATEVFSDRIHLIWSESEVLQKLNKTYSVITMPSDWPSAATRNNYFIAINLQPFSLYDFKVYRESANGIIIAPVLSLTVRTKREGIHQLEAVVCSQTEIVLSWIFDQGSKKRKVFFTVIMTPETHAPIQTDNTMIDIHKLQPSTTYTFEVCTHDTNGKMKRPGVKRSATTYD
uniref:Fibronectin type-III domain-containing protein n=2 Tax=Schistocephalus solidus TaxID=70667 RepID=A0A0X3PGW1_SCHSO